MGSNGRNTRIERVAGTLAPSIIDRIGRLLKGGQVIAYSTETFYGLGADPTQAAALERLYEIKGRPAGRTVPLIAAGVADAHAAAELDSVHARALASAFWPGPLTLVARATVPLPPSALGADGTVAIRVPGHETARAVARAAGGLVTSTSANRSGDPPCTTAAQVLDVFGAALALVLDEGTTRGGAPSTIVDVSGPHPVLVRAGVVPWDRVLESLK
jgi:L-threonylcarbamoyladenylate synthase